MFCLLTAHSLSSYFMCSVCILCVLCLLVTSIMSAYCSCPLPAVCVPCDYIMCSVCLLYVLLTAPSVFCMCPVQVLHVFYLFSACLPDAIILSASILVSTLFPVYLKCFTFICSLLFFPLTFVFDDNLQPVMNTYSGVDCTCFACVGTSPTLYQPNVY
jgi:hypothetical protein